MTESIFINKIESCISERQGKKCGNEIRFLCPAHDDHNPSARWNPNKKTWYCDTCNAGGGWIDLAKRLGINIPSGSSKNGYTHAHDYNNSFKNNNKSSAKGCSLEEYSAHKNIPIDILKSYGLSDLKQNGKPKIRIPYFDKNGSVLSIRYRLDLSGNDRFRWKTDNKVHLYGLNKIAEAMQIGRIILCEGESDCHTLWYNKFPAIGIPGANTWKVGWSSHLDKIEKIYVIIEPDQGGQSILKWLENSKINERVILVDLESYKDPSSLYLDNPNSFQKRFNSYLNQGTTFLKYSSEKKQLGILNNWNLCKDIAQQKDILQCFVEDLKRNGFVGDTKNAQILFLCLISRSLDRPVSIVVKGPSSGGKSYLVEQVLKFFPKSAYHDISAMSEHALAYSEESLKHRFLVLYEAAGMGGDIAQYLLRSLLSEGKIRYETVDSTKDGCKSRLIEKEGPTGCIITTTAIKIHPENETRLFSLHVSDDNNQTKDIFLSLAEESNRNELDYGIWHNFQEWLNLAESRVTIPFAKKLASLIPPISIRLRRDFKQLLSLIKTHAILHQASRRKDKDGKIIATLEDYQKVRELVKNIMSEGIEASVSKTVLETIEAVKELCNNLESEEVSIKQLTDYLKLDRSAVARRVSQCLSKGYLKNNEDRKRKPLRIALGDELPCTQEILPTVDMLEESVQVCSEINKDRLSSSQLEDFEERAAILEFDSGLTREEAEKQAFREVYCN
ncbi:MAG: CHC2 zinc finger domain-containing protein [Pseudomonadota bacterium]